MTTKKWEFVGEVVRAIDGDTLVVELDLGFRIRHEVVLRLAGIDAPEVVGATREAGFAARNWLAVKCFAGAGVLVETAKAPGDKYGRWLATVRRSVLAQPGVVSWEEKTVNEQIVEAGHAIRRKF